MATTAAVRRVQRIHGTFSRRKGQPHAVGALELRADQATLYTSLANARKGCGGGSGGGGASWATAAAAAAAGVAAAGSAAHEGE